MPNGSSTPPEPLTPDSAPIPVNAPREGLPPLLNTTHDIAKAAESLSAGVGILALDTERASGFTYSQRAQLIQLRRRGAGTYLIDPTAFSHPQEDLALHSHRPSIHSRGSFMPQIKIFHAYGS